LNHRAERPAAKRAAVAIAAALAALAAAVASCGSSDSSANNACTDGGASSPGCTGGPDATSDVAADTSSPLDSAADSTGTADSSGSSSGGDASDSAAPPPSDGAADAIADAEGGPPGDGTAPDCAPDAAKYVYVVSDNNTLYTFDPTKFPAASALAPIGTVPCVPSGQYVNAIAVDRHGTAYLNFHGGSVVTMTTTPPLTCTPTSFTAGQAGFTNDLGLSFAADSAGSVSETLYVSDSAGPLGNCLQMTPGPGCMGKGLATLDIARWTLTPVGAFTAAAAGYNALLAGTGDAKLYGFFSTTPSSYGPIAPASGHTDSPAPTMLASVNVGTGGYAFAFWGGDLYFFTAPTANTVPQHLATSTGTVTSGDMLSYVVVAAGSSTCAPTRPTQ
jgi:hypothetical protein